MQVLVSVVLLTKTLRPGRGMVIGYLATATAMLMIGADKWLNVFSVIHGEKDYNAAQARFPHCQGMIAIWSVARPYILQYAMRPNQQLRLTK